MENIEYLNKIENSKYPDFYKMLLSYMFEKFKLASDEDEDYCYSLLGWDINKMDDDIRVGIDNGYSLETQLNLAKFAFDERWEDAEKYSKEEKEYLDKILERYSGNSKNT